ncbi:MBL fold metallo-hydrolase [Xinfangfangia sp. CPCC 101601]|uniref:MBL fold metallo-hydrolase n=1 Tax=Pseudogemmobacter lacusdianii TaxID=3069608 RepID=A0ABU0VWG3_9RHOB|nr:MBL fold metallo-hydrolase [Xinfangfangia sp. CPCC 101601]MDQ2066099.1 MBL fold metallo-hydrolase [Xinfangfangia sp. CPCC 101601]
MTAFSRRQALLATATLPLAPIMAAPAHAKADPQGRSMPLFHRFALGDFEVTTLLAGTRTTDKPQETFGLNASAEEFAALAAENFLPAEKTQNFFTPVLVNTGAELVLFDTGLSAESTGAALQATGISLDQVDLVVLTHMHGDHIGGLMAADGVTPAYANARYVTGAIEHNHWSAAGNEGFDKNVRPLAEKMTFLDDGGTAAPGISAVLTAGHTPGHMAYRIESAGQQLMLTADCCNHFVFSLQRPDWEVRFDADKAMGAATRKAVFGMLAAERIPFIGYHMPFPGVGYVEAKGEGFRFVPQSYQHLIEG